MKKIMQLYFIFVLFFVFGDLISAFLIGEVQKAEVIVVIVWLAMFLVDFIGDLIR